MDSNDSEYIVKFIDKYEDFYRNINETVVLYALEFKYIRHTFEGNRNSILLIKQDINKLRNLKSFKFNPMQNNLLFSKEVKSLVFIGGKMSKSIRENIEEIGKENSETLKVFKRE